MEEYSYEYEVTYTVCVPVTAVTAGGRRAADTIAQTAVAKGLPRVLPEDLEKVTTEYICKSPAPSDWEARPGRNVFMDHDEKEVRDED